LTFSEDGSRLVSAALDDTLRVWDVGGPKPEEEAHGYGPHLSGVCCLAIQQDRPAVVFGRSASDGVIGRWVWTAPLGQGLTAVKGPPHPVEAVTLAPKGDLLATAAGPTLRLWSIKQGTMRTAGSIKSDGGTIQAVAFAPDRPDVALASADGVIRLWRIGRWWNSLIHVLVPHAGPVTQQLVYSPNGRLLASSGLDQVVRIWDASGDEAEPRAILGRLESGIRATKFLDDNRVLAISDRGHVMVWDIAARRRIREWRLSTGLCCQLAVSPQGLVATGCTDGRILLFELQLETGSKPSVQLSAWHDEAAAVTPALSNSESSSRSEATTQIRR
jgi:WD40 repeat protein